MPDLTADTYDAHMLAYRDHLRRTNRASAEEYIRQHRHLVTTAIEELTNAAPVALAIAQLHEAIRSSPARNFWPIIRKAKGTLLIQSTATGQDCPWPWRCTNTGNLHYKLPGYLLFSPWPPNFCRRLRNDLKHLQRVETWLADVESESDFRISSLAHQIWWAILPAKHYMPDIKAFQGFASQETVAALDRWSDEQRRGRNIALRIVHGALIYDDGKERCELEMPGALKNPFRVPLVPDLFKERTV